jgi:hypothetical protein
MKKIVVFCLIAALFLSCSKPDSPKSIFGDYPADYRIAFFEMAGISNVPTVRSLFGPDAQFAAGSYGVPTSVTIESGSGTKDEFTAVLLLTTKNPETEEEIKVARMQVTFQPDSMTERSYIRYFKLADLISGAITEKRSSGTQMDDANLSGLFGGMMQLFWDMSVLK